MRYHSSLLLLFFESCFTPSCNLSCCAARITFTVCEDETWAIQILFYPAQKHYCTRNDCWTLVIQQQTDIYLPLIFKVLAALSLRPTFFSWDPSRAQGTSTAVSGKPLLKEHRTSQIMRTMGILNRMRKTTVASRLGSSQSGPRLQTRCPCAGRIPKARAAASRYSPARSAAARVSRQVCRRHHLLLHRLPLPCLFTACLVPSTPTTAAMAP